MRSLKAVLIAMPLALGCGADDGFNLESGTFAVSDATLVSANDECGFLGDYTRSDKVIGITVDDDQNPLTPNTVTFNLSNDTNAPANTLPTASKNGNLLEELNEANYTVSEGSTCVMAVRRDVTGELTADNTATLTLTFDASVSSGNCSSQGIFDDLPCASSYRFTATRQ